MASLSGSNLDAKLETWNDVVNDGEYSGLLVGNGMSCAIWNGFSYSSLLEVAKNQNHEAKLEPEDMRVFYEFGTCNFEAILESLKITEKICKIFNLDHGTIRPAYRRIQDALVEAVRSTHIEWRKIPSSTLATINEHFGAYETIFSTNYDLLAHWSALHGGGAKIKNYFWGDGGRFDITNTVLHDQGPVILYLHGGLHLRRALDGSTLKLASRGADRNLLTQFTFDSDDGAVPLFVAEGSSVQKLAVIHGSDYLSFAYSKLSQHVGGLAIFGHGLGESDDHIVHAINSATRISMIAISVQSKSESEIIRRKAELIKKLQASGKSHPSRELRFFDSSSHPFGAPKLLVK